MASEWIHQGRVVRNRYQLSEPLAQGMLCTVYRGEDTVLRRSIVVKAVPPDLVGQYRAALRSSGTLSHPAVVATYDAIEEGRWLFLVQEYVPARPLAAYVRDGIPSERAVDLAAQIARALAYAHAHDVIHGDLTPAAVLIDRQATVRINNFGLPSDATYLRSFDGLFESTGSAPLHAPTDEHPEVPPAPEDNHSSASPATSGTSSGQPGDDVRALGLLLWQALSEPVQRALVSPETAEQTRVFRQDVPPSLRELVRRCVACSHPARIEAAETLALELEALARELAMRRPSLSEETPPALRVAREEVARNAPWSVEETLGSLRPWDPDGGPPAAEGPAVHEPEREAIWPDAQSPAVLAAPRLKLPSWPLDHPGARARLTSGPALSPAAVDPDRTREWPVDEEQVSVRINLMLVAVLGVILFLVFFLIGFFGPRLLG